MEFLKKQPSFLRLLAMTELWERFSFYGLLSLLVLYLAHEHGYPDSMTYIVFGVYMTLAYFGPLVGGILADRFFGSQKMLLSGGSLIALGHFTIGLSVLHFDLFFMGLGLVAIGTGKCVALLRMRFGRRDPSAPFALARRLYHAAAVRVTGATCTSHTAHRLSHDSTPA